MGNDNCLACAIGSSKCAAPFFCDKDGICKRTKNLRSEVTGHRIPPPPGGQNMNLNNSEECEQLQIQTAEMHWIQAKQMKQTQNARIANHYVRIHFLLGS